MPLSIASSVSLLASSSPLLYSSVLASQSGLISSSQTSITRSSFTTSLSSVTSSFLLKPYLTMHDLYVRYIPLKFLTKSITPQVSLLRVLPPIILKDLFNKFIPKLSIIIPEPSLLAKMATLSTPIFLF